MAKVSTGSITKVGTNLPAAPAFMQNDLGMGTEGLRKFVRPPRLSIVQRQSHPDILAKGFGAGDLIQKPAFTPVIEMKRDSKGNVIGETSDPRKVVILCMFPSWARWNPIELKGKVPAIVEQTTDPNHPLVRLCTTPGLWKEKYPDNPEWTIRNVQHLNFLLAILDHPGIEPTEIFCLSFQRGEHFAGENLCGLIKARKAAIFGNVFDMQVQFRDRGGWQWYGVDIVNPAEGSPWITDPAQYEALKKAHLELEQARREARITIDHDTDDLIDAEVPAAGGY